ncbi:MAG: ComEA family DNA-binding protein [Nitriliruptorales bacterium]|nr:ComEA family DNA-binding protein [Nitriliruptorales bacterium]
MEPTWLERLRRAGRWLDASPAEVAALLILIAGALGVGLYLARGDPSSLVSLAPTASSPEIVPTRAPSRLVVHVTGAVRHPGVVELTEGARVSDAIAAAGGATLAAALGDVNLARLVADGEQLRVPYMGEEPTEAGGGDNTPASAWTSDGLLDLNRASASDLEELPGIGPVLAARIIAWRDQQGRFEDVGQLREISGIGEKTFQSLAPLVTV